VARKAEENDLVNTLLKYRSGEETKKGDGVLFLGNPAEIELVAFDPNDPEYAWHVQEFGGGVLIFDPMFSGRSFIRRESLAEYEDLKFVSRARTINVGSEQMRFPHPSKATIHRGKWTIDMRSTALFAIADAHHWWPRESKKT
jgi:hypothetical protein